MSHLHKLTSECYPSRTRIQIKDVKNFMETKVYVTPGFNKKPDVSYMCGRIKFTHIHT
jgi:hypothetical protein